MRKSIIVLILLAFALMSVTAVTFAQDDTDPGHYHYNYCINGTWFCPDPDNPAREAWNYGTAWYWGLYKAGDIPYSQVPEWARLLADSDGDGVSDDADLCPNEGGNVDANGCPIPVAPPAPTTCQYDVGTGVASLGLASSTVDIPMDVVNGLSDPNASSGATPYGFDWVGSELRLYGPSSWWWIWHPSFGPANADGWYNGQSATTNCPVATPPAP